MCSPGSGGRRSQHSGGPSQLLNSITFICYFVKRAKPYDKQAVTEAVVLKVPPLLYFFLNKFVVRVRSKAGG